jgi:hypothetical protein
MQQKIKNTTVYGCGRCKFFMLGFPAKKIFRVDRKCNEFVTGQTLWYRCKSTLGEHVGCRIRFTFGSVFVRDLAKKLWGVKIRYIWTKHAIRFSLFITCCFVERPVGHRQNPNHLYKVFSTLLYSLGEGPPALCRGLFLCKIDSPLFFATSGVSLKGNQ